MLQLHLDIINLPLLPVDIHIEEILLVVLEDYFISSHASYKMVSYLVSAINNKTLGPQFLRAGSLWGVFLMVN